MSLYNQAKSCKAHNTVPLIDVCLCCSGLSVFICCLQRNNRSNFLRYYVFIIVILWQITLSQFSASQNMQPRWLIQVLLQVIIGVRVLRIASSQYRISAEVECKAVSTARWDFMCQLMPYFVRKHFNWLWPAAVLINSRGILIVASAIFFWEQSLLSVLIDFQRCYSRQVTGTRQGQLTVKCKQL